MIVPSVDASVRTPNQWHHVATVVDVASGQGKIYVDGRLDQTMHSVGAPRPNNDPIYIGAFEPGTTTIDGRIDDIRLYRRPLSDDEVAALAGTSVNAPVAVNAGPDHEGAALSVALQGAANDDAATPTANTAQWSAWRKVAGPGAVTFADRYDPQTTATFSHPGRYVLELQATDGGPRVYDQVTIVLTP